MRRNMSGIFELLTQAYLAFRDKTISFPTLTQPTTRLKGEKGSPEFCLLGKTQSTLLTVLFHDFKLPKVPASQMYCKSLSTLVIVSDSHSRHCPFLI